MRTRSLIVAAADVLPAVTPTGLTERVHTFAAPEAGGFDLTFERQDGRVGQLL